MDTVLIDPTATQAVPAPFWFIQLFKVVGFTLHMVPMGLWFAGLPTAMLLSAFGGAAGKQLSARLMAQMPIIIALGINFGIVPLLFIQLAYPQFFYSATILMAWYWMGVVALLIPAYYGVYIYADGLKDDGANMRPWKRASGWIAALLFPVIGFLLVNAMSLMVNVDAWQQLWNNTSFHGAALGTALNTGDPSIWPRWLMMFSLGLMTTAVWSAVDSAWLGGGTEEEHAAWRPAFAWKLYSLGVAGFGVAGIWYLWLNRAAGRENIFTGPTMALPVLTALLPVVLWAVMLIKGRGSAPFDKFFALALGLGQFVLLAVTAIGRQFVQNMELREHMQGWSERVEWSPLILFLIIFVAGAALIVWMLALAAKPFEPPTEPAREPNAPAPDEAGIRRQAAGEEE